MVDRRQLRDSPERRGIASGQFELRAQGAQLLLTGYAAVFDRSYEVYGGPPLGWTETVDPRAFDVTLAAKPDLHLLINHEGMPLARTKSGTLKLATDSTGLHVEAGLDPTDPDVQRLAPKMGRGDMDEMSFAFRVKDDDWNDDYTARTLLEVSLHKGDVSVVNFGANPATSAQLNSINAALELLAEAQPEQALAELRSADAMDPQRLKAARDTVLALHRAAASRRSTGLLTVAAARAMEEDGGGHLAAAIPTHSTPIADERRFDEQAAVAAASADHVLLRYMHAWVNPDGDPRAKANYLLPHHDARVGAPANLHAVRRQLALLPKLTPLTDEQRAKAERHLRRHLADAES